VAAVTVRYFAGARAARGRAEESTHAVSVAELVDGLAVAHGEPLARTLAACSFLVDGVANHDRAAPLPDGATVDVLPPFAGG
jgi:molybdopterin synthase sulfur carrier subunit